MQKIYKTYAFITNKNIASGAAIINNDNLTEFEKHIVTMLPNQCSDVLWKRHENILNPITFKIIILSFTLCKYKKMQLLI